MSSTANKKLVKEGTILFISTLIVNAGNYGINLLLGRWLGPADFSEVSLLVTLMLMLSFWALAFQLTAAKYMATYTDEQTGEMVALKDWLTRWATIVGLILAFLMMGLSFFWKDFFQTRSVIPFLIFGIGMPIYLRMSVNRGILQGKQDYRKLAITYQVEMWSRLVISVLLVSMGWGVVGVAWGLTLSLFCTLLVSKPKFNALIGGVTTIVDQKSIVNFLVVILVYECSQILINNSDTLLVKHFFPPFEAGLYAALSLIGRIVYFGTWTVVTLLFPTVIRLEKEGKDHTRYFIGGLAVVAFIAACIIGACYLLPELMVKILFGANYLAISPLLWQYSLATALFACANVFVYYHLSLDRRVPVGITIVGGLLQIILITLFHQNFEEVIHIQIYLMTGLLLAMICYQFIYKKIK